MSESLVRSALQVAAIAVSCGLFAGSPLSARAQDEVIADPELDSPPKSARGGKPQAQPDGEEVFADPELEAGGGAQHEPGDESWKMPEYEPLPKIQVDEHDAQANTGIAHIEAIGQFGADLHHEGNLEDAYETRLRFDAEVEFRRSRKLRLSVGLRTDLLWAMPARDDAALHAPEVLNPASGKTDPATGEIVPGTQKVLLPARDYTVLEQDRFELDLIPLSAFVDVTPANGFHMRIGTQPVSTARMDFYSPNDILAVYDLRGQPKLAAGGGRLSQPAVRMDWDMGSWATLQVIYLPWFMPNLSRPNRDLYVARVLGTGGNGIRRQIDDLTDPSFETKASESSVRWVGPAPDFATPQAEARLNMRGHGFELALSGGTALEKMPSYYLTPLAERAIRGEMGQAEELLGAISKDLPVVDVAFHRYEQVGLDGSFDVSPFSVGFELAYSPSRTLAAAALEAIRLPGSNALVAEHLPQPNVTQPIVDPSVDRMPDGSDGATHWGNLLDKSIRKGVPVVQAALHLEYMRGETLVMGMEGFMVKALELPYDKTRDWWGFIPGSGIYAGGLMGFSYRPNPDQNRWRIDLSLVALVGPSLIAMPLIEYRVTDSFYLNVAAQIFEGPKQQVLGGAQSVNAGGLYSGYDQVLMGFRYVP